MIAIEEVFKEVDNRVTYGIGGRVGIVVGFKGRGVEVRKAGV